MDAGFREGDTISPYYDPMIAKLIVWGETREVALARMRAALGEFEVVGVATNIGFLGRVVGSRAFAAGDLHTGLIERNRDELFPADGATRDEVLAFDTFAELPRCSALAHDPARTPRDPHSPWHSADGWRPTATPHPFSVFRARAGNTPVRNRDTARR